MAVPDPLIVRTYKSQVDRWRHNASSDSARIQQQIALIVSELEEGRKVTTALGAAKNMARDVAELINALSAVAVLEDMQFVVEDPDAKEATPND